jgi:hypothetical protein
MDLEPHLQSLREALASAASAGGAEAEAMLERFAIPLDAAFRLAMLDVVSEAAAEISDAIAPGRVDVRWRERNPELAVTPPSPAAVTPSAVDDVTDDVTDDAEPGEEDDVLARVSLRLPARLKSQVDDLAAQAGLSSNAWLVRAVAAAATEGRRPSRSGLNIGQRYSGWSN